MDKHTRCILLDWGDTLMRNIPEFPGPMWTWPHIETIPHAKEVLAKLNPDWILALATNAADSDEADIWKALRRGGLDAFLDKVYCFRSIGCKKASPDFFSKVISDLKVELNHIVMVGDDWEADILPAIRSGIRAIWYNFASQDESTEALVRTIHDLRDLPAALESFSINKMRKC